jgi:hypothetical protein
LTPPRVTLCRRASRFAAAAALTVNRTVTWHTSHFDFLDEIATLTKNKEHHAITPNTSTITMMGCQEEMETPSDSVLPKACYVLARGERLVLTRRVVKRLPLLETMFTTSFPQKRTTDGAIHVDLDPNLLKACVAFVETYKRRPARLFQALETSCSVEDLVLQSDYLLVDLPCISTFKQLLYLEKKIKKAKQKIWTFDEEDDAKDAVAILCISLARKSLQLNDKDQGIRQKVVNDTLFILSHARAFPPRLRTHLWQSLSAICTLTQNEQKMFEQWTTQEALLFEGRRKSVKTK